MAETTIQWAHYTFNPWVGCQRVSPGCEHCYAETYDKRVGGVPKKQRDHYAALTSLGRALKPGEQVLRWGPTAPRTRTSPSYWRQPFKWNDAARAAGVRSRVFCASLADVFEDRPELYDWRADLFELIARTPHLDWLLLTKRPERVAPSIGAIHSALWPEATALARAWIHKTPPANVWIGTTVEDRARTARLHHLREIPAAVRFVSFEPLLEPLGAVDLSGISWAIIGGESGGNARRFDVAWARYLIARCRKYGVAPFVKQMGAHVVDRNDVGFEAENETWAEGPDAGQPTRPEAWPSPRRIEHDINGYREEYQGADARVYLVDRAGGEPAEWPLDLRVREFPKVAHG